MRLFKGVGFFRGRLGLVFLSFILVEGVVLFFAVLGRSWRVSG